jgi:hypothetical protein
MSFVIQFCTHHSVLSLYIITHMCNDNVFPFLVWGQPLNADDYLNGKKVQQEMTITEKTRQAIRAGIESANNNAGEMLYSECLVTRALLLLFSLRRHTCIMVGAYNRDNMLYSKIVLILFFSIIEHIKTFKSSELLILSCTSVAKFNLSNLMSFSLEFSHGDQCWIFAQAFLHILRTESFFLSKQYVKNYPLPEI